MTPIKLYDSLTQTVKPLIPLSNNHVTIYCCGITPYDASHLGHASVFLFYDTLIRFLNFSGYTTTYVQNITDVDDDILKKARETHEDWRMLGARWVNALLSDFEFLNIKKPDYMPRATEVIDSIIQIITSLKTKKFTYEVDGTVYFSIKTFKKSGALSRLPRDRMITLSAERGNNINDPNKKDPLDFVLWQKSLADEPSWDSRWGQGRPGWHIECSAMSMKFLGQHIDIHGGGADLIFPHHESEIAQSESYTGKSPFVNHWLHSAMVYYKGEKMSKSLGNLVFVSDLAKKYSGNAIRWLLLSHHYRKEWEYTEKELEKVQKIVSNIESSLISSPKNKIHDTKYIPNVVIESLHDDFNSPQALEILTHCKNNTEQSAMWKLLGFR